MTVFNGRLFFTTATYNDDINVLRDEGRLWEIDPNGVDEEGTYRALPIEAVNPNAMAVYQGRFLIANTPPTTGRATLYEVDPDGANNQGTRLGQFLNGPSGMTTYNCLLYTSPSPRD